MTDDRTTNLNLPKPHPGNNLSDDVGRLRSALDGIDTAIDSLNDSVAGKQATLGFTPEDAANKGQANGYAGLDGAGKVPSAQLPSYVDDVVEAANYSALPGTGETGKIYVTTDTGDTYRWSGSVYVLIGSGGSLASFTEEIIPVVFNGQDTFQVTNGYTPGLLQVLVNGVEMTGGDDDYIATGSPYITFTTGLATSDQLKVRKWSAFDVANATPADNSVGTGKIQNYAVTGEKIANGALGSQHFQASIVQPNNLTAAARADGRHTIWVPASAMIARTTNGAASGSVELTTGADIMLRTFDFDTATEEAVQFTVAMPKSWDENSTISAMFYWTAASGSGTVAFGLRAGAVSNDDPLDTTEVGTGVALSDTLIAANDLHVTGEISGVTVGNSPAVDDLIWFEVYREVASDTLGVDAKLIGVKLFYTTDAGNDA